MNEALLIVGVSRGNKFSPNHVDNDAMIFNNVAEELRQRGYKVEVYPEKDFVEQGIKADFIFCMARDTETLNYLKTLEDEGAVVINSAYGIASCVRKPMTELLLQHKIPHPKSWIIPTNEAFDVQSFPCWIKRGDSQTIVKEDVCYITCREEAEEVMANFRQRNIPTAVVNEHLVGDLIKFYGVQGTDFFYWFYPTSYSHSKFGLEKINGKAKGFPFSVEDLHRYSDEAAKVLNVPIYGGDCVVLSDGTPWIIDFNDWPSFVRCREDAGKKIAECIHNRVKRHR